MQTQLMNAVHCEKTYFSRILQLLDCQYFVK